MAQKYLDFSNWFLTEFCAQPMTDQLCLYNSAQKENFTFLCMPPPNALTTEQSRLGLVLKLTYQWAILCENKRLCNWSGRVEAKIYPSFEQPLAIIEACTSWASR